MSRKIVMSFINCFLIVGFLANLCTTAPTTGYTPKVDTKIGPIVGIQKSYKEGKVNYYVGVPYAEAPVGDLRLKKPVPYKGNGDVIKATDFKPICYQPRIEIVAADNPYGQSEDCLYLDIVQPANVEKDGKKVPVVVIVESLGLNFLTELPYLLVPMLYLFSLRNDIITVYVGSRRNFFGYAYSKDYPELQGNYALWDQNLGLRWIQENIQYFNGDPDKVTLIGNGPGSTEVAAHVVSHYAKGLFARAIMLRSALVAVGDDPNGRTSLTTNIVIKRVGCEGAKDVLDCLQKVPPKKIIDSLTLRYEPLRPVLKSEYVPTSYSVSDSYFNDVDLLIGVDRDAASNLVAVSAPQVWADVTFTYDDAFKIITKIFNQEYSKYIAKKYIGSSSDTYDDMEIRQGISNLFTDIVYTCPLIEYGYQAATKQKKGKTYALINYYQPSTSAFEICKDDPRLGVCEREFGALINGDPFEFPNEFNNTDRQASAFGMELITNFIRTGSQSKDKWPSFNSENGVKLYTALFMPDKLIIDKSRAEFCHKNVYDFEKNVLDKYYPLDPKEKPEQAQLDAKSSFYGYLYDTYYYTASQFYRL